MRGFMRIRPTGDPRSAPPGRSLRRCGASRRAADGGRRAQAVLVPGHGEAPELLERHDRPAWNALLPAPLVDPLFRPEEEHRASRVDEVGPPLRGRHGEVGDDPLRVRGPPGRRGGGSARGSARTARRPRPAREARPGFPASPTSSWRSSAVADPHPVLGRDARERRRHADGLAVRLQEEDAASEQPPVRLPDLIGRGVEDARDLAGRRRSRGPRDPQIDRGLHSNVEVHARASRMRRASAGSRRGMKPDDCVRERLVLGFRHRLP